VDELQQQIELDSTLNTNNKKRYLRGLAEVLQRFEKAVQSKEIPVSQAPGLIDAFIRAMQLDRKGESIEPVIAGGPYETGKIVVECFNNPSENKGARPARLLLTRRYYEMHPALIFNYLSTHPGLPYEDSLIIIAGHHDIG